MIKQFKIVKLAFTFKIYFMDNPSARNMWGDYLDKHLEDAFVDAPKTIKFYNTENEANACVNLVLNGSKRATSFCLLSAQARNEPLPNIGAFFVITDWSGIAKCIVKITAVKLKPFFSIDKAFAEKEGEGDKSLAYWQKRHWDFFTVELDKINRSPKKSMIIVCVEFEKVY